MPTSTIPIHDSLVNGRNRCGWPFQPVAAQVRLLLPPPSSRRRAHAALIVVRCRARFGFQGSGSGLEGGEPPPATEGGLVATGQPGEGGERRGGEAGGKGAASRASGDGGWAGGGVNGDDGRCGAPA